MSRRESRSEARRDVGDEGGRRCDSGSRCVEAKTTRRVVSSVAAGNWSLAVIEQGLTCWAAVGAKNLKNFTNHMQIGVSTERAFKEVVDLEISEAAAATADKQGWRCSANGRYCGKNRAQKPRTYWSVSDRDPSSSRDEQK